MMISISAPVRVQAEERMLPPQYPAALRQKRLSKDRRSELSSASVPPEGPDELEAELGKVSVAITFTNSERSQHLHETARCFGSGPSRQRASQTRRNAAAHFLPWRCWRALRRQGGRHGPGETVGPAGAILTARVYMTVGGLS